MPVGLVIVITEFNQILCKVMKYDSEGRSCFYAKTLNTLRRLDKGISFKIAIKADMG